MKRIIDLTKSSVDLHPELLASIERSIPAYRRLYRSDIRILKELKKKYEWMPSHVIQDIIRKG